METKKIINENVNRLSRADLWWLFLVVVSFLIISLMTMKYTDQLQEIAFLKGWAGVLLYVLLMMVGSVTPLSAVPAVPLAVSVWGGLEAVIYTVGGWWLGAMLAFFISRKYGKKIVSKFVTLEKLQKIERLLPKKNLFVGIILLRIFFPVDVLSFALGMFSNVSLGSYAMATLIGILPFAILLAFFSEISWRWQIFITIFGMVVLYLWWYRHQKRQKN